MSEEEGEMDWAADTVLNRAGLIVDLRSDSERDDVKARMWMEEAKALAQLQHQEDAAQGAHKGRSSTRFEVQRDKLVLNNSHDGNSKEEMEIRETTGRESEVNWRYVLHLDPLQSDRFMTYLERNWLTSVQLVQAGLYKIMDGRKLHALRMDCLNANGLLGLNEAILELGGPELCAALQAITEFREQHQQQQPCALVVPDTGSCVVIHCVQGKDRTGLLAMLVQSIAGCSDAEIVTDYQLTEQQHNSNSQNTSNAARMSSPVGVTKVVTDNAGAAAATTASAAAAASTGKNNGGGKLDRQIFAAAPAQVMQDTLTYLRHRYGSVFGYLDAIGFDPSWRYRLQGVLGVVPHHRSKL
jgi:Tyrosine phosphatase family